MTPFIILISPKKDKKIYTNNISLSFELIKHILLKMEYCINILEPIPSQKNWMALSTLDILKDETACIKDEIFQLRHFLNSAHFKNALLQSWSFNEELLKHKHNYVIDNNTKYEFYNSIKNHIARINTLNIWKESQNIDAADISKRLIFVNQKMRAIYDEINQFNLAYYTPLKIASTLQKELAIIQNKILKPESMANRKMLFEEIFKQKARRMSPSDFI